MIVCNVEQCPFNDFEFSWFWHFLLKFLALPAKDQKCVYHCVYQNLSVKSNTVRQTHTQDTLSFLIVTGSGVQTLMELLFACCLPTEQKTRAVAALRSSVIAVFLSKDMTRLCACRPQLRLHIDYSWKGNNRGGEDSGEMATIEQS